MLQRINKGLIHVIGSVVTLVLFTSLLLVTTVTIVLAMVVRST